MALTIGNWIVIGIVILAGAVFAIVAFCDDEAKAGIIICAVAILLALGLMFGLSWYNKNTASGARAFKDFESNLQNGILREITITAEDGREIFHYEGKIDIETSHSENANYILFESEEGLRHIIYYGIQDTVLIIEKPENKGD